MQVVESLNMVQWGKKVTLDEKGNLKPRKKTSMKFHHEPCKVHFLGSRFL